MSYQWDRDKAEANMRKHGIDFADSIAVFEDQYALTIEDDFPHEQRFVTIGMDTIGRVLVVVYTWRQGDIRVISARRATRRERQLYEQ